MDYEIDGRPVTRETRLVYEVKNGLYKQKTLSEKLDDFSFMCFSVAKTLFVLIFSILLLWIIWVMVF